jgi:hypothetical protein
MEPRWNDYFIDPHFQRFWKQRLADRDARVCVITGSGFDPRAILALSRIEEAASNPTQVGYVAFTFRPPTPLGQQADAVVTLSEANSGHLN